MDKFYYYHWLIENLIRYWNEKQTVLPQQWKTSKSIIAPPSSYLDLRIHVFYQHVVINISNNEKYYIL